MAARKWAPFPRRFHLVEDSAGRKTVLEEMPGKVVIHRTDEVVAESILRYCYERLGHVVGADISPKQAASCKDLWWALTPPLAETPVTMAEKSVDVLTFNRLTFDAPPFDKFPDELPPRFGHFIERCTQKAALCAFIGSLFFPEANRQQYLYLFGAGQDGKGALIRLLYKLLGDGCQAVEPKEKGDRFWNMKTYGKRLLVFTDCANPDYFVSPGFKALTGDDPIYFEPKGKMGFTAMPTCKVLVASNIKPSISSQTSDLRRLIYVEVKPFDQAELVDKYEDLLLAEAEDIIRLCKTTYLQMCPEHGPIPADDAREVASEAEETFTELFLRHFVVNEKAKLAGHEVLNIVRSAGITRNVDVRRMKEVWARVFGIRYERVNHGRFYCGMTHRIPSGDDLSDRQISPSKHQDDRHDEHYWGWDNGK